jgi:hypothetical protein
MHVGGISIPAPAASYPQGLPKTFGMTRAAHETLLRRLVKRHCPSVQFVTGTVTGVTRSSNTDTTLSGVTYRAGKDTTPATLNADLIIDCTGVTHAGLAWLQRAGFALDKDAIRDSYNPHMRYTSSEFQVSPAALDKILPVDHDRSQPALIFLAPAPGVEYRYLCILRSEANRSKLISYTYVRSGIDPCT